ncbi:MAG TPA: Npt1/Npt2 family nucleotide transporter [Vicinamibacteria bacterium]|nr:Npt1/Npt2 family nucleotide transporter [Vicinamibacteria bacterium]
MGYPDRAAALLGLEPGEGRAAGLMAAHSFALGLSTVFFETAASALFLSHFQKDALPYVYIAAALLNTAIGVVYSAALDRLPFARLMQGTLLALLLSVLGLRGGLALASAGWLFFVLLVFYRILSALTDLEYWAVAARLYDVRQAKRLYGVIGTGEVVARILGSFSVPLLLRLVGVRDLLVLSAVALLACIGLLARILPMAAEPAARARAARGFGGLRAFARLLGNAYLLTLFATIVFGVLAKYFVDYAFLGALKTRYADPARLASFFALFSGTTQVLSLLARLFVSGPLIERHGIRFGLVVLPLFQLVCTALIVLDSALFGDLGAVFWLAIANQGVYKVLKHPIDSPSFKVLYQPLRRDQRLAAQIAVETMVTPITTGLAGAVMLFFTVVVPYTPARFGAVMLVAFAGWVVVARRAGRAYSTALVHALRGRLAHDGAFEWSDARSVAVLEETLKSERPADVLFALDLLERSGHPRYASDLLSLLDHPNAEVRRAALLRVERVRPPGAAIGVSGRLAVETHDGAREAAVRALLALDAQQALPCLLAALDSPSPGVRAASAAGLSRQGLEGAARTLRDMAESRQQAERVAVARVSGDVRHPASGELLLRLMRDPVPAVRRAAHAAAGRLADPSLLAALVRGVGDLHAGGTVSAALLAAGGAAVPDLLAAFRGAAEPRLRIGVARVLGRIRDPRAQAFLREERRFPDEGVRTAVLEALRASGHRAGESDASEVEEDVRREVDDAAAMLAARRDLGAASEWALLGSALDAEVGRNRSRLFLLLSFLHDPRAILRARDNLAHPAKERRAYAHEVLEVTLPRATRELVMPLLEELPAEARLERLEEVLPQPRRDADERVREVLELPPGWVTPWTRAAALYCVGRAGRRAQRTLVAAIAAQDGAWLVRETAAWAAAALGVAGFEKEERGTMLTLERVIILKSVEMFEGASEEALADVASILEEVEIPRGQVIFRKGDLGDSLYVIVEGAVRVFDGETTVGTLGERDIFGELALLDPEPRSASIMAIEDSKLFRLDREAFSELMAANIEIVRGVLHVLCERLRRQTADAFTARSDSRTNAPLVPKGGLA